MYKVELEVTETQWNNYLEIGGDRWLLHNLSKPLRGSAPAWLIARLRAGPQFVTDVLAAAKAEGISADRVRRARRRLRAYVHCTRNGNGIGSKLIWTLVSTPEVTLGVI